MTTNQLCEPGRSHTLPGIQSPLLQEGQRQLDSRPTGSSALEFYQGRASSPPLPSGEQFQHLRTARETPEGLVLPHLDLGSAAFPMPPATFSCGQIREHAGGVLSTQHLSWLSSVILCAPAWMSLSLWPSSPDLPAMSPSKSHPFFSFLHSAELCAKGIDWHSEGVKKNMNE